MNYFNMVKNAPNKSEEIMWDSVKDFSDLLEMLEESNPDLAKEFLKKEYRKMYGKHFDENFAKELVENMYHYNDNGSKVVGEMVNEEDSFKLVEDLDMAEELRWDAYVGANGFMHDLSNSKLENNDILELARLFWFHDDDFNGCDKVQWYFMNK